jgi:outer membrane protein assembly factor BamB
MGSTLPAAAIPPTNWPQWRGPNASGVADGQAPPITWDVEESSSILWKTPIPGLGHSSPIVWGDRIFLTSAVSSKQDPVFRIGNMGDTDSVDDRSSHVWKIFSLDKQTGEILWERNAHEGVPRGRRHIKSSFANSTMATDGKFVVAFFGPEGLYTYNMEGDLLWQRDLGMVGHPAWGFSSSPIIYSDMVIVQCDSERPSTRAQQAGVEAMDSFIAAFALADGSERWRKPRDEVRASFASPTIYKGPDGAELITNSGRQIRGYEPETGEVLWSLAARTRNVTPTPIVAGGLIFVTSGFRPTQPIYAIRLNAVGDISLGEGQEANEFIVWSKSRGGPYTPTPIVYGKYMYTVNVNGILACYEAETGMRAYRVRLHPLGGGISSSPVAADGRIYFSSEGGDVFVVKAGPEFELLATNSLSEVIMATPAISGGIIFIRTLHHLFAID